MGGVGQTPLRTPIRDKLNINAEDEYEDMEYTQFQQVSCLGLLILSFVIMVNTKVSVLDQLEDGLNSVGSFNFVVVVVSTHSQREQKNLLKRGLASLPAPRNDYEIVVPEQDTTGGDEHPAMSDYVEDQADLDAQQEAKLQEQSECYLTHRMVGRL